MVDKSLAKLKMDFPNFAPQAMVAGKIRAICPTIAPMRPDSARSKAIAIARRSSTSTRWRRARGNRADGALYWKAYALIRLGRQDEARAAIAELRKSYASSRWLDDAKALEVEAGKPVTPESESDEELKLIALNGLMQSDPDRALPLLDSLLKSAQPPKIKRQAIFVLAQSNSPKAQQLLEQVARGQGNPDLQLAAIRYLGERRRQGGSNPILAEIYASSNDVNVKRAILNAFESARDKDRLLQIAKTEKQQDLRLQAIRLLGSIQGTQADLWALYQAETTPEGKQQILESMPSAGNLDKTARGRPHGAGSQGAAVRDPDPEHAARVQHRRQPRYDLQLGAGRGGQARHPGCALGPAERQGDDSDRARREGQPHAAAHPRTPRRHALAGSQRLPDGDHQEMKRASVCSWRPRCPWRHNPSCFINAQTDTRSAAAGLEREYRTLLAADPQPAWIGYSVPAIRTASLGCDYVRDSNATAGVVHLEPPDHVVVLFRVENHALDRVRAISPYCEIDAGGLPVHWLNDVQPAQSVGLLVSLVPERDRTGDGALHAMAVQADPSADAALERFLARTSRNRYGCGRSRTWRRATCNW